MTIQPLTAEHLRSSQQFFLSALFDENAKWVLHLHLNYAQEISTLISTCDVRALQD